MDNAEIQDRLRKRYSLANTINYKSTRKKKLQGFIKFIWLWLKFNVSHDCSEPEEF